MASFASSATTYGKLKHAWTNRQLLILSLVYFDKKFHTFPHELSPSCNSAKMCDHFTIELNMYTALWNIMGVMQL